MLMSRSYYNNIVTQWNVQRNKKLWSAKGDGDHYYLNFV